MKRIAPLALAACAFALSFTVATPADAAGRNDRRDRPRVEQRHRDHDRRGDRHRQRIDRHHRHRDDVRYESRHRRDRVRDDRIHHHDRRDRVERYDRRHRHHHVRFDVPRVIQRRHHTRFRPYFDRHVWYGPHRHDHEIYWFPVVVDGYRTYRRYDYCAGELFHSNLSIGYDGPRFGIHLNF